LSSSGITISIVVYLPADVVGVTVHSIGLLHPNPYLRRGHGPRTIAANKTRNASGTAFPTLVNQCSRASVDAAAARGSESLQGSIQVHGTLIHSFPFHMG
jgi:hypothetical protein